MSDSPRYRCAAEMGQLPQPQAVSFAKLGYSEGFNQRVEQGDEFSFDGIPAKWMEPINDAAIERVETLVAGGKRGKVAAESAAVTQPLKAPPRSGMTRAITESDAFRPVRDVRHDENPQSNLGPRPAPRRRATKAN